MRASLSPMRQQTTLVHPGSAGSSTSGWLTTELQSRRHCTRPPSMRVATPGAFPIRTPETREETTIPALQLRCSCCFPQSSSLCRCLWLPLVSGPEARAAQATSARLLVGAMGARRMSIGEGAKSK